MSYTFFSIKYGFKREENLVAYWEVAFDYISDDFTPDDISAKKLFKLWVEKVWEIYPDGLVPIYWFIRGEMGTEFFPYQLYHSGENFLDYWTHPVDKNGNALKFIELPVVDKLWNKSHCRKGGFIQQATGWKPSILQHVVYLPSLLQTSR